MRLNKFLAHAGVASRRACDELIRNKKVRVNNKIIEDFSFQVKEEDYVVCNGKTIQLTHERHVYLVHKPAGYISTSNDTHGRKKVIDLIFSKNRLYTIGRLDRDTTGIILVTNDGDLANRLMHPKFKKEKKYIVETKIDIPFEKYSQLSSGLTLEDGTIAKGQITRVGKKQLRYVWEIVLTEGKNREVKRIFEALESKVVKLHRFSFAGLELGSLKLGRYRKLSKVELKKLYS
jgi:pseudouridine synthase